MTILRPVERPVQRPVERPERVISILGNVFFLALLRDCEVCACVSEDAHTQLEISVRSRFCEVTVFFFS